MAHLAKPSITAVVQPQGQTVRESDTEQALRNLITWKSSYEPWIDK